MSGLKTSRTADVQVRNRGQVPDGADVYAQGKMLAVIGHVREPVLTVRVKLTQAVNTSANRPATAQAVVDVNGRMVRATWPRTACSKRSTSCRSAWLPGSPGHGGMRRAAPTATARPAGHRGTAQSTTTVRTGITFPPKSAGSCGTSPSAWSTRPLRTP